jgi:predicted PurR-regulated permease PerM
MNAKLEMRTFLWLLLLISLGFLWLLRPFFAPIFWACALAIIFYPLQLHFLRWWPGRRNSSALATLCVCFLMVIAPVIFVVSQVVGEAVALYNRLQSGVVDPAHYVEQIQRLFPQAEALLSRLGVDVANLKKTAVDTAMSGGKWLAQHTLSVGQNAAGWLLDFGLMLYLSFFMLRDGHQLIDLLVRALPLGDKRERKLFALFGEVTRATVKGNLVVAVVQGVLGGGILWVLGMPGALLWGVFIALASLIPAVGPALIWAPIALYWLAIGMHWQAAVLAAFGVGVIGLVDNILRPILVGRDTQLPDYVVLLSTLGGLAIFGINGFVIGPLVAALFIAFWGIFMNEVHVAGDKLMED